MTVCILLFLISLPRSGTYATYLGYPLCWSIPKEIYFAPLLTKFGMRETDLMIIQFLVSYQLQRPKPCLNSCMTTSEIRVTCTWEMQQQRTCLWMRCASTDPVLDWEGKTEWTTSVLVWCQSAWGSYPRGKKRSLFSSKSNLISTDYAQVYQPSAFKVQLWVWHRQFRSTQTLKRSRAFICSAFYGK